MNYPINVHADAVADIEMEYTALLEFNQPYAEKWISALREALTGLQHFPNRFPLAPESKRSPYIIRQFLVGHHRVLFAVHGNTVHILRIRHAARRPFKPGELN